MLFWKIFRVRSCYKLMLALNAKGGQVTWNTLRLSLINGKIPLLISFKVIRWHCEYCHRIWKTTTRLCLCIVLDVFTETSLILVLLWLLIDNKLFCDWSLSMFGVSQKYYPPDFDPSKIPKLKLPKDRQYVVRLMAPFNMRCVVTFSSQCMAVFGMSPFIWK